MHDVTSLDAPAMEVFTGNQPLLSTESRSENASHAGAHAESQPSSPRRVVIPASNEPFHLANHLLAQNQAIIDGMGNRRSGYLLAKRIFDLVGASCLIVLFSPILLTTLIVLAITTKGKPLFFQERIGYRGKKFRMVKFRTMRLDADKIQQTIANEKDGPIFKNRRDPRITRIGRFLHSSSIDEMPQLFNVLFGSMSLVGPRPPVAKEVVQYRSWQRRRLAVQPGLTCLWQISGRSEIKFEDWVRMDLWYLENQSFWTDLKLLVKTPASVISGRGAY